jgi:hypothetical protein
MILKRQQENTLKLQVQGDVNKTKINTLENSKNVVYTFFLIQMKINIPLTIRHSPHLFCVCFKFKFKFTRKT